MKVRKYRAPDRASALKQIRDDLGPEAMIVQEQRVRASFFGLFGEPQIEILAAIEDDGVPRGASGANGAAARATNGAAAGPTLRDGNGTSGANGVEATFSAAARRTAAASTPPEDALRRALSQPGGLSDEGASKLAAILETFPKNGRPVPPAMAQTLADLIARATASDDGVAAAPTAPKADGAPSPSAARPGPAQIRPTHRSAPTDSAATDVGADRRVGPVRGGENAIAIGADRRVGPVSGGMPAPSSNDAAAVRPAAAAPSVGPAPAPSTAPASDGLATMQHTLQALQTAVDRLARQQQDAQLPREAPAVRIAYQHLIQQEMDPGLALDVAGQLSEEFGFDPYVDQATVNRRVAEVLEQRLSVDGLRLPPQYEFITRTAPPAVAVLVGATGVGKTTTLAKLASHFAFTQGRKVALITTDTYRIAAAAQLGTYAEILELPLEVVYRAEEIPGAISRHMDADLVLVDTPGCGQHDQVKIGELQEFVDAALSAVPGATVLLTLSAPTKLRDLIQVRQGFARLNVHGLVFTKLDETTAYGPLVSFAARVGKPVYYVTTGQRVPNDIEPASRERLAGLLFQALSPNPGREAGAA